MANSGVRRHYLKIVESFLSPAQKSIALDIPLHFQVGIDAERIRGPELIHLHGMVDHQFRRQQGIDFFRISAQRPHRIAHRRQVHHRWNAGKILQQHARWHERNFLLGRAADARRIPTGQRPNILRKHKSPVFVPQQILQQHFQRKGQPRDVAHAGLLQLGQAVNVKRVGAGFQRGFRGERVFRCGAHASVIPPVEQHILAQYGRAQDAISHPVAAAPHEKKVEFSNAWGERSCPAI